MGKKDRENKESEPSKYLIKFKKFRECILNNSSETIRILNSFECDDFKNIFLVTEVLKFITHSGDPDLLNCYLDKLANCNCLKIECSILLNLYSDVFDKHIKLKFLKIFEKLSPDSDLIQPVMNTLDINDDYFTDAVIRVLKKNEKALIASYAGRLLRTQNNMFSIKIINILEKLDIISGSEAMKRINILEKKEAVRKAEQELSSIKINNPSFFMQVSDIDKNRTPEFGASKDVKIKFVDISDKISDMDFDQSFNSDIEYIKYFMKFARLNDVVDTNLIINIANKIVNHVLINPSIVRECLNYNVINNFLLSHTIHVAYYSVLIALMEGEDRDFLVKLCVSALVHDIGMMQVKDLVWNLPRKLTSVEFVDIEKHTLYGLEYILNKSNFSNDIAYVCYQHHERFDNSGYPKGRGENTVSRMAQYVMVADVFDGLSSDRVYRNCYDIEDVITVFNVNSNLFNQKMVRNICEFFKETNVS